MIPTRSRCAAPSSSSQRSSPSWPITSDVDGVRTLVVVPISFVFEHMGTLNEIDREYAYTAKQAGITTFVRVPTLGTDPSFIDTLASVVVEALPDLSRPSMQQINEGNPVSLSIVNECADGATRRNFPAEFRVDPPPPRPRRYTRLYTKDQLQLVPQERPWGFTEQAEVVNGRLAMAAITLSIALTSDPSLKALVAAYRAARNVVGDAASAVGDALPLP